MRRSGAAGLPCRRDLACQRRLRRALHRRLALDRVAEHPHRAARRPRDLGRGGQRLRRRRDDPGFGARKPHIPTCPGARCCNGWPPRLP